MAVDANTRVGGVVGGAMHLGKGGFGPASGGVGEVGHVVVRGVGAARGKPASKVVMVRGGGAQGSIFQWRLVRCMYPRIIPTKGSA